MPSYQTACLFASDTDVVAYDKNGLLWESERISHDGFSISRVNGHSVEGLSLSLEDEEVPFFIDLRSGIVTGGSFNP